FALGLSVVLSGASPMNASRLSDASTFGGAWSAVIITARNICAFVSECSMSKLNVTPESDSVTLLDVTSCCAMATPCEGSGTTVTGGIVYVGPEPVSSVTNGAHCGSFGNLNDGFASAAHCAMLTLPCASLFTGVVHTSVPHTKTSAP